MRRFCPPLPEAIRSPDAAQRAALAACCAADPGAIISTGRKGGPRLGGPPPKGRCTASGTRALLQRLDLHLAPLQHARAVLQPEWAVRQPSVLHVGGLLPVQDDDEVRALRRDLEGVPLAAGLRH